ncbi:MAG: dihydrolipoyl dehydrogenase [Desulfosarcinaceae bacterium]|nr:dihydrolipoyl dehydrogenase [Desulfosarcinaceae bacterium]
MTTPQTTQLVVIGAGPGGYAAAFMAADLGLQVTLVDPAENPGGVCLYRGCIPSKTLLHAARVIDEIAAGADWGLQVGSVEVDRRKLQQWKDGIVGQLTGGLGQLVKRRKITYLQGRARFTDNRHLEITGPGDDPQPLGFETAIIATGSLPMAIPALSVDDPRLWDSTAALKLETVPGKLLVVGGGYIGLELGSVYAALGSRVTVVEMTPDLLPGADRDLVRPLQRRLKGQLDAMLTDTTVTAIKAQKNGLRVALQATKGEKIPAKLFDAVLVAVGRRPRTAGLGLTNTAVVVDDKGFIQVDAQRRTAEPHILAIGDVAGEPMLAHKASHEGRVAAEVAAGHRVVYDPAAIPAVVFTDPEIAWVGLTESEAKAQGRKVTISKFPWGASGRALTLGRNEGVTKLVVDPENQRILGVGLAGPGAGEMIAEGALAIEMGANAMDLGLTIHPHPTLSETLMEAADAIFGTATHIYRPPKKRG